MYQEEAILPVYTLPALPCPMYTTLPCPRYTTVHHRDTPLHCWSFLVILAGRRGFRPE